jgi:hypothetical protein
MTQFLAQACINLRPDAGISIDEDGIHWYGVDNIPTQSEIDAEIEKLQTEETAKQKAQVTAKQSAMAKLSALGLTADEVKALIGG